MISLDFSETWHKLRAAEGVAYFCTQGVGFLHSSRMAYSQPRYNQAKGHGANIIFCTFNVVPFHVPAILHGADDVQSAVHVALLSNKIKRQEAARTAG
jgi:hypothetical protein